MINKNKYRFIIAAGGTGGHLYPAIAVAQSIKELKPEAEFLFVGTSRKIEARVVPQLGFNFKSIWISGLSRKITLKNILFPLKLVIGSIQALMLNIKFKPSVAIGAGAYVSGPVLWSASLLGSKIMLLEQNSYPGVTNRMLEKKANEIHISFEDSKKYFRFSEKLLLSGNPIRLNLILKDKIESINTLNLDANKKTLLVIGGSLGAGSINEAIGKNLQLFSDNNIQIIWQTGSAYYEKYKGSESKIVKVMPFIEDMSSAYSAADLVVARAGATTIAEVSSLGLPVIFVPSPNVAANHQYKNAMSLVDMNACSIIEDNRISQSIGVEVLKLIDDEEKKNIYSKNIKKCARPEAANIIAKNAIKLAENS
ncbi:MAG: undecaprenyldiphospho-muramoylpentapeptide beta-N-acetylglucosaminyltransferase [Melioribacteraceae bacterium]|nr:undecaprenyldiphospho-muramoylpentapeptide beta-N-acetylglucosaminyltransferase [Melioribacteraceae bacterium]